jgi:hypothetical protein
MSSVNEKLGFGFYHSGVCVFGYEWAFGGNRQAREGDVGIFAAHPRTVLPAYKFHEAITLGFLPSSVVPADVTAVLQELGPQWLARSYHLLSKNCNHFAEAFVKALQAKFGGSVTASVKGEFPAYVNRAARFADVMVPDVILNKMMGTVPQPPPGSGPSAGPPPKPSPPPAPASSSDRDQQPVIPLATPEEMSRMTVKELKTMMWVNGVAWDGCLEKSDLIAAVEAFRRAGRQQPPPAR